MSRGVGASRNREKRQMRVVVIGAGVSGCACGAALAEAGLHVTVLGAALDRVGEPSFGALLARGEEEGRRARMALDGLPDSLEGAWRGALLVGADGEILICDRRLVSIGSKWALESTAGVELRQGLAVSVGMECGAEDERALGEGRMGPNAVRVETAFGEEIRGDAVVVAVGMGLRGSTASYEALIGEESYGYSGSGGLEQALRSMGAQMSPVELEVERRMGGMEVVDGLGVAVDGPGVAEAGEGAMVCDLSRRGPFEQVRLRRMQKGVASGEASGGPPSPYQEEALWGRFGVVERRGQDRVRMFAWPDGLATGEVAVRSSVDGVEGACTGPWGERGAADITRSGGVARGAVVTNLARGGLLDAPGGRAPDGRSGLIWVTGRAGGAKDYVASLAAGTQTASVLVESLRGGVCCG